MLEAIKLKARIHPNRQLEIPELPAELPEGEVELILLYEKKPTEKTTTASSPLSWPILDGGRYLGGTLRREELYDANGR